MNEDESTADLVQQLHHSMQEEQRRRCRENHHDAFPPAREEDLIADHRWDDEPRAPFWPAFLSTLFLVVAGWIAAIMLLGAMASLCKAAPAPAPKAVKPAAAPVMTGTWSCSWSGTPGVMTFTAEKGYTHSQLGCWFIGTWKLVGTVLTVSEAPVSADGKIGIYNDWQVDVKPDGAGWKGTTTGFFSGVNWSVSRATGPRF